MGKFNKQSNRKVILEETSFRNGYESYPFSVESQMKTEAESYYARKMIHSIIEIQDGILKIPELSQKQKEDLANLRSRLDSLDSQAESRNIKMALVDVMNSLN